MPSVDVIHTVSVPAFRPQEDAVPGITTGFRAPPDRLGTYPIIGTQLCGYVHSTMRTTPHVVTAAASSTWLAEHGYTAGRTGLVRTAAVRSGSTANANVPYARSWTVSAPLKSATTDTKEGTQ
jgi:cytochrome c oxidase subunit II